MTGNVEIATVAALVVVAVVLVVMLVRTATGRDAASKPAVPRARFSRRQRRPMVPEPKAPRRSRRGAAAEPTPAELDEEWPTDLGAWAAELPDTGTTAPVEPDVDDEPVTAGGSDEPAEPHVGDAPDAPGEADAPVEADAPGEEWPTDLASWAAELPEDEPVAAEPVAAELAGTTDAVVAPVVVAPAAVVGVAPPAPARARRRWWRSSRKESPPAPVAGPVGSEEWPTDLGAWVAELPEDTPAPPAPAVATAPVARPRVRTVTVSRYLVPLYDATPEPPGTAVRIDRVRSHLPARAVRYTAVPVPAPSPVSLFADAPLDLAELADVLLPVEAPTAPLDEQVTGPSEDATDTPAHGGDGVPADPGAPGDHHDPGPDDAPGNDESDDQAAELPAAPELLVGADEHGDDATSTDGAGTEEAWVEVPGPVLPLDVPAAPTPHTSRREARRLARAERRAAARARRKGPRRRRQADPFSGTMLDPSVATPGELSDGSLTSWADPGDAALAWQDPLPVPGPAPHAVAGATEHADPEVVAAPELADPEMFSAPGGPDIAPATPAPTGAWADGADLDDLVPSGLDGTELGGVGLDGTDPAIPVPAAPVRSRPSRKDRRAMRRQVRAQDREDRRAEKSQRQPRRRSRTAAPAADALAEDALVDDALVDDAHLHADGTAVDAPAPLAAPEVAPVAEFADPELTAMVPAPMSPLPTATAPAAPAVSPELAAPELAELAPVDEPLLPQLAPLVDLEPLPGPATGPSDDGMEPAPARVVAGSDREARRQARARTRAARDGDRRRRKESRTSRSRPARPSAAERRQASKDARVQAREIKRLDREAKRRQREEEAYRSRARKLGYDVDEATQAPVQLPTRADQVRTVPVGDLVDHRALGLPEALPEPDDASI